MSAKRPAGACVADRFGRPLRDLRISVTDRCNFRCRYCMPREVFGEGYRFLPPTELLTFDEIARLTRVFARLGVRKVRLTGGEPLLRPRLADLVQRLAAIAGLDIALTTNGSLLAHRAGALKNAGLQRVTVSLDSLDEDVFAMMNDAGFPVSRVLEGIDAADGVEALIADDPDGFAERVLRVLGDPALAARLSSSGRALVAASYTWEASGQRLLALVDRVMEGSRP